MGGVPVLLMMAAVGITFGWQPDNDGGVEYVIQIPPDEVHELEHLGEISSVIDPAVRGHVSRVIIRVGNSTPPRITPPNLARTKDRLQRHDGLVTVSDQSPVPIPEMDDRDRAIPIPSTDSSALSLVEPSQAAVMKPDANDPASGPGFRLPSVPSSLRDATTQTAQEIRGNVDRAGRDIGARASGQLNTMTQDASAALRKSVEDARNGLLVPPPATRTPSAAAPARAPQFTGSDPTGEMARVRAGGPSTDPTDTRDNTWRDFTGPRRGGASTEPVGPSGLDSNNPFGNRRANTQANSADAPSSGRAASGLAPGDTFGKMPSGLSVPGGSNDPASGYKDRGVYADRNLYADRNSATSPDTRQQTGVYSQYEQTQLDRQSQYSGANPAVRSPYDRVPSGQWPSASGLGYDSAPKGDQQMPPTGVSPDSRLTAAQIAAGAWTVDVYGRAIDRQGRLVDASRYASEGVRAYEPEARAPAPVGQYANRTYSSLGRPNPNSPAPAVTSGTNVPSATGRSPYEYGQPYPTEPASSGETRFAGQTNPSDQRDSLLRSETARRPVATDRQLDPPSISTRRPTTVSAGMDPSRQKVAAQPLFNGLLLISFVANVYLIFWLKNLRIQFRDLVAAKRIANSNNVQ